MYSREYKEIQNSLVDSLSKIKGKTKETHGEEQEVFQGLEILGMNYSNVINHINRPRYRHYLQPSRWKKLRNMIADYISLIDKALDGVT